MFYLYTAPIFFKNLEKLRSNLVSEKEHVSYPIKSLPQIQFFCSRLTTKLKLRFLHKKRIKRKKQKIKFFWPRKLFFKASNILLKFNKLKTINKKIKRKKNHRTNQQPITTLYIQRVLNSVLTRDSGAIFLPLNYSKLFTPKKFWRLAKRFLRKHRFLRKTRVALLLVQSAYALLRYKDPTPLNNCLKDIFEKTHFNKHRSLFYMTKSIVHKLCRRLRKKYNLLGLKIRLAGKLGVGGNAKKRRKYFNFGRRTNTTKCIKREDIKDFVRTRTGVFGYYISVFY